MSHKRVRFDYDDLHRRWLAGETHAAIGAAYGMSVPAVAERIVRVRVIEGEARWPWRARRTLPPLPSLADGSHA